MQKARRFTCSTVCQSSPSNTSVRTRQKSRTSSVGGDTGKVRISLGGALNNKTKSGSAKCNVSGLSSGVKPKRKAPKQCRVPKPNVGSLQGTVVLAPFYTLKKCFQNKLVDMYSHEKMKNLNHKAQMAKKTNMSFEYDIIELKPLDQEVKKEGKSTRKSRPKSRSASYCQCNRVPGQEERKVGESNSKQKRKASTRHDSPRTSTFSEHSGTKRRKLNPVLAFPASLKYETAHGHDFYAPKEQVAFSGANQGSEVMSSMSKCESWETYSNSPSCKEELMQGSLAISTTSFDSYLEHFDRGNRDYSESNKKCNTRMQKQRDQSQTNVELLPKSTARSSIVNFERKNSDGEIVDFMDREPQTQVIPSTGSYQKWQPLRRQSKTKRKKPENDSAATGYYLRSCSKGALGRTYLPTYRQQCETSTANMENTIRTAQVEVGTQFEEMNQQIQCPNDSNNRDKESQQDICHEHILTDQTQEEPSCDLRLSVQKMQTPPREPDGDPELPQSPQEQQSREYFEGQPGDTGLGLLEEHSDLSAMELMAGFSEPFQGPADSHQPQDKEYIFGPRNSTNGLGESCEFSFGLKWVLSDDED